MSDVLGINQPAPEFALPADNGEMVSLSQFRDKSRVLIFFYPGDFTPVCTAEVCAFRDDYDKFEERDITILGISADPVEKHRRFAAECKVPFRLLSDVELSVSRAYGARGLLGMRRAYFFIDTDGTLLWQHAEVLPIFKLSNARLIEEIDEVLARQRSNNLEGGRSSDSFAVR